MSPGQDISAIVRSPDSSVTVNQALMAGELANRQAEAALRRDTQRRESLVMPGTQASASEIVGESRVRAEGGRRARKALAPKAGKTADAESPTRRVSSHIDLLV